MMVRVLLVVGLAALGASLSVSQQRAVEQQQQEEEREEEPFSHMFSGEFVTVETSLGGLRGRKGRTARGQDFTAFQGVPYAQPPVGTLRFKPPQPAAGWRGTLNATGWEARCPQLVAVPGSDGEYAGSEDCLHLNIFLAESGEQGRPVMVWLHGGGFTEGGSDLYMPSRLIEKDVIVVTVNYRLGPLGFLTFGNTLVSGNMGLRDQQMALAWLKQHIAEFGGDPDRVTVFGADAGGVSAQAHLLSPRSSGLVAGAISQSGTLLMAHLPTQGAPKEPKLASLLADSFGCGLGQDPAILDQAKLECLQAVDVEAMVRSTQIRYEHNNGPYNDGQVSRHPSEGPFLFWWPVVDTYAEDPVLPTNPLEAIIAGQYNKIPYISGSVENDGAVYLGLLGKDEKNLLPAVNSWETLGPRMLMWSQGDPTDLEGFTANIIRKYYDSDHNDIPPEDSIVFNTSCASFIYTGPTKQQQASSAYKYLMTLFTDGMFTSPDQKAVQLLAENHGSVYNYHLTFSTESTNAGLLDVPESYSPVHGDEVLYLFDQPSLTLTPDEETLADQLTSYWANFASRGSPSRYPLPEWQSYSPEFRNYLDVSGAPDGGPRQKENLHPERMLLWDRLVWAPRESQARARIHQTELIWSLQG